MKAAQITSYHGPRAVVINEIERPNIKPSQVLVQVIAAGINPFDWKMTEGYAKNWVDLKFPATIGGDVAGVVMQVGAEVHNVTVGQKVFGSANPLSRSGSFADFAPVDSDKIAVIPQTIDAYTAAAYPLSACSAYQAIVATANVQIGQKVLVHGGVGGVGTMAIQMAKQAGAYVATTASSKDLDYARGLGADETFDYKNDDFAALLDDYDVVLDTVGGDTYEHSYDVLKPGGQLLSLVEQPNDLIAKKHQITALFLKTSVTSNTLEEISRMIDSNKLIVHIAEKYPLEQTACALAHLKEQHVRGKIVITVS